MLLEEIDNISDLCHQQRARHGDGVRGVGSADESPRSEAPVNAAMPRVPVPLVAAARR